MDKSIAPIQITAEQILLEAFERQADIYFRPAREEITDEVDLADYLVRRRREFEETVGRSPNKIRGWIEYASWELSMQDLRRMRSVMERSLISLYTEPKLWLVYAELELKAGQLDASVKVFERATRTLPRVDKLWIVYVDVLRRAKVDLEQRRGVFESWMSWHPPNSAWLMYAEFEMTCGDVSNARKVLDRMINERRNLTSYRDAISFEKFKMNDTKRAALLAKAGIEDDVSKALDDVAIFWELAGLETDLGNYTEARSIYKFALDNVSLEKKQKIGRKWVAFERKFGRSDDVDYVCMLAKRFYCQSKYQSNPYDYDAIFDWILIEQEIGDHTSIVDLFENLLTKPPNFESPCYQRYLFIWIYYANFLELKLNDAISAQKIYNKAIESVPLSKVSVPYLLKSFGLFYVRHKQLEKFRQLMELALSHRVDQMVISFWADVELSLGNSKKAQKIKEMV
ncbi:hypothetical protein P9112_012849 [Eukaryota sp. TZLM1-RC]